MISKMEACSCNKFKLKMFFLRMVQWCPVYCSIYHPTTESIDIHITASPLQLFLSRYWPLIFNLAEPSRFAFNTLYIHFGKAIADINITLCFRRSSNHLRWYANFSFRQGEADMLTPTLGRHSFCCWRIEECSFIFALGHVGAESLLRCLFKF